MSRKNIRKFSWSYELVRKLTVLYHRAYYRKLKVMHREKIPAGKPVIFIFNHQNALMDALSVVYTFRSQCVFMARADIFRKKMAAALLFFLKILPAYRIRDGFHSVDQNKKVFKEVISVLENNNPVALFPEGSHLGEKRLRPFKKGAARLALLAEEANGFNLGLSIVPVGIDYSNYYHAGSDLLVTVGDPVSAAAYRDQYLQNPVQAINNLTNDLAAALNKVVINITTEEHYQVIRDAIAIIGPAELKKQHLKPSLHNSFKIKKELSEKITHNINQKEKQLSALKEGIDNYRNELKNHKIRDLQISNPISNPVSSFIKSIIFLLLLPIHLYGMILNYLPYGLPIYLARNIKDPHFISSVRFVYGMLFFFFWYLLLIILSFIIFNPVLLSLAFIISLPLTGIFSFYYYRNLLRMRADFRWMSIKYRKRADYESVINKREQIISTIEELISK
jgi:1-acyl-sn-glycerol-3-phosphate acyltransferase